MSKQKTASRQKSPILPIRRDLHFKLPAEKISDWNDGSVHISQFMNTLSIVFPVGERFFIQSVRNYRDRITDPELKKAVTAFIGQEAMHGREHEEYNEALFARVPAAARFERLIAAILGGVQRYTPKSAQLSATIALEHFTAILADGLLKQPEVLAKADPRFGALWYWHALEETEHKSVAFDVWESVMGRGPRAYVERAGGLVVATAVFWALIFPAYLAVLRSEGRLADARGWGQFLDHGFGRVGFLRKRIGAWFDYFRPGFHPWDEDNRHFLKGIEGFAAQVEALP
ncbi:metal-dependent hydrolase [Solimonas sp. K1W22B-7]|uniref:metal-dependent hydrolase n=1 Tax=Solimonas sp. K1W22B-7 TaxID=2303331 RepID=UPI000E33004A|nr:metal-dependent hydrolase [Solimonas sp. K1W22B-7]AXQ27759.1 metal-dependent hydrolase [Solimonas sp. K1W22B-7]